MNPAPIAGFYLVVFVFSALLTGSGLPEFTPAEFEKPRDGFFAFLDVLLRIVLLVWEVVEFMISLIANLVTFNIAGMPGFLRIVIATPLWVAILWGIAGLVRGGK